MSNFKKIVLNISNTVKETISRFPLTIGVIVIISTFISICIDRNWVNGDLFLNITVFGYIFVCGTLLSESYFSKWIYRIITYSITGGISIVFTICINYSYLISKVNTKNLSTEAIRIAVGYGIILILLSLYKILKDSKLKFEEYLLKVFSNLFVSCITYIILNIGIWQVISKKIKL